VLEKAFFLVRESVFSVTKSVNLFLKNLSLVVSSKFLFRVYSETLNFEQSERETETRFKKRRKKTRTTTTDTKMVSDDAMDAAPTTTTAAATTTPSTNKRKIEVKKWNAVAVWSWSTSFDSCAICRNTLHEPSIEFQANSQQEGADGLSIAVRFFASLFFSFVVSLYVFIFSSFELASIVAFLAGKRERDSKSEIAVFFNETKEEESATKTDSRFARLTIRF
jgi:hypothetical protein